MANAGHFPDNSWGSEASSRGVGTLHGALGPVPGGLGQATAVWGQFWGVCGQRSQMAAPREQRPFRAGDTRVSHMSHMSHMSHVSHVSGGPLLWGAPLISTNKAFRANSTIFGANPAAFRASLIVRLGTFTKPPQIPRFRYLTPFPAPFSFPAGLHVTKIPHFLPINPTRLHSAAKPPPSQITSFS